jgi:predicted dehydrogenase
VFGADLPEVRLVAIADAHQPFAADTARRYGYERVETSWEAIAADIGTHLVDIGEFLCGPIEAVRGAALSTRIQDRPVALGASVGHAAGVPVSDVREPVGNEDIAMFTATFASGATGTFSVSRIAYGLANGLGFQVFCERGAAGFDLGRAAESTIADGTPPAGVNGYRQVLAGPEHPYLARGLPMDFPSVGHGQNDLSSSSRGPSSTRSPD